MHRRSSAVGLLPWAAIPLPSAAPSRIASTRNGVAHLNIDIDRLARLAALRLDKDERAAVQADLRRIVAMVDRMRSIDTEGVEPLAHPLEATQRLRPDAPSEKVDRAHYQAGAPATRKGLYIVPRVVD